MSYYVTACSECNVLIFDPKRLDPEDEEDCAFVREKLDQNAVVFFIGKAKREKIWDTSLWGICPVCKEVTQQTIVRDLSDL